MAKVKCNLYQLLQVIVPPTALADALSHLSPPFPLASMYVKISNDVDDLWHCRLGHISYSRLALIKDLIVNNHIIPNKNSPYCICLLAKQHKLSFPIDSHKSSTLFEWVHWDIWGPCYTMAYDGSKYFLTIVNDFSRATRI